MSKIVKISQEDNNIILHLNDDSSATYIVPTNSDVNVRPMFDLWVKHKTLLEIKCDAKKCVTNIKVLPKSDKSDKSKCLIL